MNQEKHTLGRRQFTKLGAAALGLSAFGSTVVAAESTNRFIVEQRGDQLPDVEVVHELPGVNFAVVRGSERDLKRSKAVKSYAPDIDLQFSEPSVNTEVPTFDATDYEGQPGDFLQWDKEDLDVPSALEVTEGEGTRVTIIDSGVYADHPDLDVNMDLSMNFTGDGEGAGVPAGGDHGTHVAGIVAATNGAGLGVNGTAPKTDLVDCRVFSYGPGASFGDILAAVVYSANIDADVANLSLGAYPIPRQGLRSFYGKFLNTVMTYANNEGTLLVISAGNDGADLQHDKNLISLPNEGAQALSVAATGPIGYGWGDDGVVDPAHSPAFYTNYGTNAVVLGAPGGDADLSAIGSGVPWYNDLVFNTTAEVEFEEVDVDGDGEKEPVDYLGATPSYGWKAGTSMAAPQVAGAAALVKSANPDYNANQLREALKKAASVPEGYDKAYYGAGYLNITDAL